MKPQRRRGMTAIEVLTATVLASLMLGSVISVLGSLARQQRVLRAKTEHPDWHERIKEQLRWDLQNARELVVLPDRLRLTGFAGRDFVTGRPTGRPAAIEYFFIDAVDESWFVRREEHLDARHNDAWRIEVVCCNVNRMEVGDEAVQKPARTLVHIGPDARPGSIPERLEFRLFRVGSLTPILDELFIVL